MRLVFVLLSYIVAAGREPTSPTSLIDETTEAKVPDVEDCEMVPKPPQANSTAFRYHPRATRQLFGKNVLRSSIPKPVTYLLLCSCVS